MQGMGSSLGEIQRLQEFGGRREHVLLVELGKALWSSLRLRCVLKQGQSFDIGERYLRAGKSMNKGMMAGKLGTYLGNCV